MNRFVVYDDDDEEWVENNHPMTREQTHRYCGGDSFYIRPLYGMPVNVMNPGKPPATTD
jgi:hypothetical protein